MLQPTRSSLPHPAHGWSLLCNIALFFVGSLLYLLLGTAVEFSQRKMLGVFRSHKLPKIRTILTHSPQLPPWPNLLTLAHTHIHTYTHSHTHKHGSLAFSFPLTLLLSVGASHSSNWLSVVAVLGTVTTEDVDDTLMMLLIQ